MPTDKTPKAKTDTKKKTEKAKKLAQALLNQPKHSAEENPASFAEADAFCKGYKSYLDKGKTEREAAAETIRLLEKVGYKPYVPSKKLKTGDRLYLVQHGKAVIAATIGKKPMETGLRLSIAHIDSPRLDLKPNPLYQSEELAYFKTHYYGGVRKYQWVTIPLAMHGVVMKNDGSKVEICLGEDESEPAFVITDLLPHLAAEQNKRSLAEGIKGEELNILIGSLPYEEPETKEAVKLETMRLLNKRYGFTEKDFARAEIEFVPAVKARDLGFDASMLGAYGQDDRVCAYTALMAQIDGKMPQHTTVCILADKEETGSDGNTGLAGDYVFHFLQALAEDCGAAYRRVAAASCCLSADVNAAYDPSFPEPFDKRNSSLLNHGVVLTKYTGARGKSGTSDASAEYMCQITRLLDEAKVPWQIGELGRVDAGGGGTVAKYVANHNINVVDMGVPVLSMHAPFEVTAKLDVYSAYRAFLAFNA